MSNYNYYIVAETNGVGVREERLTQISGIDWFDCVAPRSVCSGSTCCWQYRADPEGRAGDPRKVVVSRRNDLTEVGVYNTS